MHIINFKKKLTAFFLAASAVCTLYAQQELSLLSIAGQVCATNVPQVRLLNAATVQRKRRLGGST